MQSRFGWSVVVVWVCTYAGGLGSGSEGGGFIQHTETAALRARAFPAWVRGETRERMAVRAQAKRQRVGLWDRAKDRYGEEVNSWTEEGGESRRGLSLLAHLCRQTVRTGEV